MVKVWEVRTGRCSRTWSFGEPIKCVAWCPNPGLGLLAVALDKRVVLLPTGEPQRASLHMAIFVCMTTNIHCVIVLNLTWPSD